MGDCPRAVGTAVEPARSITGVQTTKRGRVFFFGKSSSLTLPFFLGEASGKLTLFLLNHIQDAARLEEDWPDEWVSASVTVLAGLLRADAVVIQAGGGILGHNASWSLELRNVLLHSGESTFEASLTRHK